MPVYKDQLGRAVQIESLPQRIVSLVPSQTELLYDLGLNQEVVGITKFCIHPKEWFRQKQKIGGTKSLALDKIIRLQPDVVFANKEENIKQQIEAIEKIFPVWVSDVQRLTDAVDMIREVAGICGRKDKGESIAETVENSFKNSIPGKDRILSCCYLIWRKPYMTVGGGTFIDNMLSYAGFHNIFSNKKRYPQTTLNEISSLSPDLLLLSSEPYPFSSKHVQELQSLLPAIKICLVDGSFFSWYGSRLLKATAYFKQLHAEAFQYFR
ncbi:MAG: helical backbone metal receptor [Flavisolibacter sp.]